MAAITSQILNQAISDKSLQQSQANQDVSLLTETTAKTDPSITDDTTTDQNTLTEIQAIQQAILEEDFDFSLLEAPAAGGKAEQSASQAGEKTLSSPLLIENDDLLISFRHESSGNREILAGEAQTDTFTTRNDSDRQAFDEIMATDPQEIPNLVQGSELINGFLSEDFVTQTQGSFEPGFNINPQIIETPYGTLSISNEGRWSYQLANSTPEVQSLAAGETVSDRITLNAINGEPLELIFSIQGNNDQAVIGGQKAGNIQAISLSESTETPVISGQLSVSDIDNAEAAFISNTNLKGNFGNAEINSLGEWRYTLNHDSDAVLGLKSGEKLFDLFSVKTLDGSKQLIQISIEGIDDKPVLGGNNLGVLDLETQLGSSGSLTISDPDFGESTFQEASGIVSNLGYGYGSINAQGEWQYNLDTDFTQANPIAEGDSRVDSFEVLTADGTSQTILIPIQGSNQPLFAQANQGAEPLMLNELISNGDILDNFITQDQSLQSETSTAAQSLINSGFNNESANHLINSHINDIGLV